MSCIIHQSITVIKIDSGMGNKELFILRHAKSSWDEPNKEAKDRPLTSRGIHDAHFMANQLKKRLSKVDLILSSHANRAEHTATIFTEIIGLPFDRLRITSKIYETTESQIMTMVKNLPNEIHSVIIVGHNPTFTDFANRFLDSSIDNIPTAGIVGLTFNTSNWEEISKGNLLSSVFEFPKKEQ